MRVYFDSSAFVKRYVAEVGTVEVLEWCERASELAMSIIAVPELISAFCRLRREGRIDADQYRQIKGDFLADIGDALLLDATPLVIQRSILTMEMHPLRAMGAIHVGAALNWPAEVFVSADARQCGAARALGLHVIDLQEPR